MSVSRETTPAADTAKDRPTGAPSKATARPTRATVAPITDLRQANKPSKADIIKESQSHIKTTETAKKWLADHDYIIVGEDLSISALTMALFYLANGRVCTSSQLVNGIRAIALCLDEIGVDRGNPSLAKEAAETTASELAAETATILTDLADKAIKSIAEIETKCKEILTEVQTQRSAPESQTNDIQPQPQTHPSYAEALKKPGHPMTSNDRTHRAVLAKEEMLRKQILVDGIEGIQDGTEGLTPKLLVTKANLAIDLMAVLDPETSSDKPKDAKIVSARVLSNKGVILEAINEDTATWLRGEKSARAFTASISSQAHLKPRAFHIAIEFVPTSLNDQLSSLLKTIETENGLKSDSLVSARWMRAPNNWREDQRSAHAILTTNDPQTANAMLKEGLIVEGSRLQTRKLEEEPKRCFKCQKFSTKHTAASCTEITCWCPNCAKPHAIDECRTRNRSEYACIGCRAKGLPDQHAAWDRKCPGYIEEKTKIMVRHPEYEYKFYLTNEPWTWERKPDGEGSAEKWRGNTYEDRRTDPLWKHNAARRNDSGWGQRLGTGTLGNAPIRIEHRRRNGSKNAPPDTPQASQTSQQLRPPPISQPQSQPLPLLPQPQSRPQVQTQPQSQSQPQPTPQVNQPTRNAGASTSGRGATSRTRGRSASVRRPSEQQPREPSTSQGRQTTISDWFDEYERGRIRDSQKEWGNEQPPDNTQL